MIHRLSHGNDRFKSGKYANPKRYGDDQGNADTVRATGIILPNNRLRTTNCGWQCASPGQLINAAPGCGVVLVFETGQYYKCNDILTQL